MNNKPQAVNLPPLKVDCIEIPHVSSLKVARVEATNSQMEILEVAFKSYGFLLHGDNAIPKPANVSFSYFANRVESTYDVREPRNAAIVNTLRAVHQQQVQAVFKQAARI